MEELWKSYMGMENFRKQGKNHKQEKFHNHTYLWIGKFHNHVKFSTRMENFHEH